MTIDDAGRPDRQVFAAEPRVGVLECSRRLGVARGTVQARLDRMARDGVIRGWGPELDPAAMGYPVTAFVTLEIRQHQQAHRGPAAHDAVAEQLATIPEVLEAHTTTGAGDMLVRIVARSNADLQRVIDRRARRRGRGARLDGDRPGHPDRPRVLPLVREATATPTAAPRVDVMRRTSGKVDVNRRHVGSG